jgi:hypothetical protein
VITIGKILVVTSKVKEASTDDPALTLERTVERGEESETIS